MIVTARQLAEMGFCASGQRDWCAEHGVDFREFVANGVDIEVMRATDDGLVQRAVQMIEERING